GGCAELLGCVHVIPLSVLAKEKQNRIWSEQTWQLPFAGIIQIRSRVFLTRVRCKRIPRTPSFAMRGMAPWPDRLYALVALFQPAVQQSRFAVLLPYLSATAQTARSTARRKKTPARPAPGSW